MGGVAWLPGQDRRTDWETYGMQFTTKPAIGIAMGLFLILAGWYLLSADAGTSSFFGWAFLGIGVVSAIVNILLWLRQRR